VEVQADNPKIGIAERQTAMLTVRKNKNGKPGVD
jgi:hypothetical protein